MTKIKNLLAIAALLLSVSLAKAGVKEIGTLPNGDKIIRIKTAGVFAPSTTTVCRLTKSGELIVLNGAGGPGFVPAVANAGGLVGAAAVLRPARSNTNVEQSGGGATSVGVGVGGTATGGTGGAGGNGVGTGGAGGGSFVPPGHSGTNPGNGH
jgi:hypothetical protein